MSRLVLALFAISTLAACEGGKGGFPPDGDVDAEIEEGITPAPFGGGFCCPIDPQTCDCFRNGGWIANRTDMCPGICDQAPVNTRLVTDQHGCQTLEGPESCLQPPILDAGVDGP